MNKIKISSKQVLEFIKNNVIWFIGCSVYSISINCFALPNNIAQSGVSGLAIVAKYLFPQVSLGIWNLILNIPLLILALVFIGKAFVAQTLWVTAILSFCLDLWRILPTYTGDRILASLFAGLLSGTGLAIVIITGATSGGTDIVGRVVHKLKPHVSVGKIILAADAVVVITAAIVFKSVESALYAVIVIYVSSKVIDTINYGLGNGKMLMIITEKGDEISQAITRQTPRGVTKINVEGAYTGENKQMLVCVVRAYETPKINKIVKSVDPNTFIIVSEANEILGKGFKKSI